MKRQYLSFVLGLILITGCSKPDPAELPLLIPDPVSMKIHSGHFVPKAGSTVTMTIDAGARFSQAGHYRLVVGRKGVTITAGDSSGLFYGIQTLRQFAPVDEQGLFTPDSAAGKIPALEIEDFPRFGWRGLMLDCSRTFLPVTYLKKTIDRMSMYKLNVLHLHLTDDQGWRIEIRRYPELTTVCSKFSPEFPGETSGYYTQAELIDLVKYAADKHITVVPEIEMPGHSSELFAAYPGLSCTGIRTSIFPFFSGPGITDDILCAGKDTVFAFLQNVLDEVMEIFPSAYIHIGGDEAPKVRWKECRDCQNRMKQENLQNESELQSYFIKRITAYIQSRGRQVIGWDEILEGGLAEGAAVMSWRGTEGGMHAAKLGHPVVMSPTSHCYFDYSHTTTSVEKVYSFDPVPPGLDSAGADLILGGQANLWTHIDRTEQKMDRQLYPRLIALSEALWSSGERKDVHNFLFRLNNEYSRMKRMNIPYYQMDVNQ